MKRIVEAGLQENKQYAEAIPDDISSAMTYSGPKPLIFLLLDIQGQPEIVLYDATGNHLVPMKEDELLNLIQCSRETLVAEIDVDQLERLAQRAKRHWMEQRQIGPAQEVSRICALYLVPEKKETGLGRVLEGKV